MQHAAKDSAHLGEMLRRMRRHHLAEVAFWGMNKKIVLQGTTSQGQDAYGRKSIAIKNPNDDSGESNDRQRQMHPGHSGENVPNLYQIKQSTKNTNKGRIEQFSHTRSFVWRAPESTPDRKGKHKVFTQDGTSQQQRPRSRFFGEINIQLHKQNRLNA